MLTANAGRAAYPRRWGGVVGRARAWPSDIRAHPLAPHLLERPAILAKLDEEIADLERRHTELVDAAAEVGIAIELLPTVKARREAEAKQRARDEGLARQRLQSATPQRASHGSAAAH